jgi:hypothetical protein
MPFLIAPVATAIFGAGLVADVVTSLVVAGISFGVSALLQKPRTEAQQQGGVELDIQVDGAVPQSFVLGTAVVKGSRVHIESYGTNNTDCIEFIGLGDKLFDGIEELQLEGQPVSLTDTGTDRGSTVDGYDSKLAVKFFDGSQTTADAYAVAALSSHPDRPWTANHVGRGRAYLRVHYVYDREKVPGPLSWKIVARGVKLYNPAKDTTVGGSGSHRWGDLSTHEHTNNIAVHCYNVLRGIRVPDGVGDPVHFYGLEDTSEDSLPLDVWFAAIAEADVVFDTALSGGTEPQFHGGIEIPVNMEPLEACREMLKATGGRLVSSGGIYKLYLGAPPAPSFHMDDGVIPAGRSDLFRPITPIASKVTYVSGSYMAAEDGWVVKPAPPRLDADQELAIGRRVEASLEALMVQSPSHIQRVMEQILRRAQRNRRHTVPLPPELFGVETGDVGDWDSDLNFYVGKLFEVEAAEIDVNLVTTVTMLETDPEDYDPPEFFLPHSTGSLTTNRPAAKVIPGFDAEPFIHEDNGIQKPAVRLFWDDPEDDDVIRVKYELRVQAHPTNVVPGDAGEPTAQAAIILGVLPNTYYEVRGRFESFNGFATDWSLWIEVLTPNVDTAAGINAEVDALLEQLRTSSQASLAAALEEIRAQIEILAQQNNGAYAVIDAAFNRIISTVGQRVGRSEASVTTLALAQATDRTAIATFLTDLFADNGDGSARVMLRFIAAALEGEAIASADLELEAGAEGVFARAAIRLAAYFSAELGYYSRVQVQADYFDGIDGDGNVFPMFSALLGGAYPTPVDAGQIEVDLRKRRLVYFVELTADAQVQFPLGAYEGAKWQMVVKQTGTKALTWDLTTYVLETIPTMPVGTDVYALFEGTVLQLNPIPVAEMRRLNSGTLNLTSTRRFSIVPAVSGRTIWDLDFHGPCSPPVGSYTVTPLGSSLVCSVDVRGPGGSSGGGGNSFTDGGVGTDSSFDSVVAGAGGRTLGSSTLGADGVGGTAGVASGGDTNTNGSAGSAGDTNPSSPPASGGNGAAAPSGGAAAVALTSNTLGDHKDGVAGNAPGGGAAGGVGIGTSSGASQFIVATPGGGSGAKSVKAYIAGVLIYGVPIAVVVGDSGAAGTGSGNIGYGPFGDFVPPFQGAKAAAGQVTIT